MAPKQPGLPLEFSLEDVVGVDPPAPAMSDLEFSIDDVVDVVQPSAPRERMYVEGSPEIGPLPNIQSPFLARPEPYAPPQIAAAPTPTPSRAAIPVPPVGSPWLDRGEPYRPPQAPVEPTLPAMAPVPSHAAAQPPMAPPALAPSHQRPEPPRSILEPQGPTLAGQFVRHAWGGLVSGPGASIGRLLADAGVISEEGAKRLADMHADVTESKASGHILDDPKGTLGNPYWWAEAGGQVGGSVLGLYAASITGGPRLALMGEAALEGTGAYDQARSSGASPEQAGEAAAAVVLASLPWIALTNRPLFDAPTTSRIVNAAVRILSEGGQEAGQEIIQDTSAKVTYDPSRPMVGKGTFDAAVIGGLVGPLAGAAIDKVTSIGAPAAPNAPAPAQPQAAAPSAPEASVEFSVEDVADVQPSPTTAAVEAARAEVNLEPTDAQKEAGNYKKGHVRMHGLDITVENPVGSERSGTGADGKPWSVTMPGDYGYVKRTEGADGDQVDVYIGPDHGSQQVFVVDQVDLKTGKFDEHKAILGTSSEADALKLYAAGFSDGKGGDRVGGVTPMSIEEFGAWAREGDTSKPLAAEDRPADTKKASPTDFSAPVSSRLPVRELSDDEIRREWADGAVRLNTKTLPDYDERLARHRQVTAEMGRRAREGSAAPEQAESKPTTYESWDTEDIIGEIETADARGRAQMLEELARRGLTPEQVRGDEPIGPKSVGSGQTPAAAAQSKPAVKPKGTPASKEGPWASVGRNAAGQELFEDPRGVRSVIEDGVRITEPVTLRPTRAGMQFAVDRTGDRAKQWEVASDVTAEPSPAPATTPAQAYPAAEEKALKTIRKWANWDSGDDARGSGRVNYEREDKAAEKLAELVKRVVTDGPGRFVGTITPNLRVVAWGTSGSLDDARLEFKDGADQWQIVTTIDADEAMAVAGAMELPQEEPAKPESAAKKTAAEMTDEELAAEILADIEAESAPAAKQDAGPRRNAIGSDLLERALSPKAAAGLAAMFKRRTNGRDLRHVRRAMEVYQRLADMANDPLDREASEQALAKLRETSEAFFLDPNPTTAAAMSDATWEGLQTVTGEEDPDPGNELLEDEVFASAQEAGELVFETLDPRTASFDLEEFNTAFGDVEFRREPDAVFPAPETLERPRGAGLRLITQAEADARIAEWKATAAAEGRTDKNKNKVVYSLFDVSGVISQPWRDAGYTVRQFDIKKGEDLMDFGSWMGQVEEDISEGLEVVGVLAQPPCTSFAVSGARWWQSQHDAPNSEMVRQKYGLWAAERFDTPLDYANHLVAVVKLFVAQANPRFYVMENPVGRINSQNHLPAPRLTFDPANYGNPYTKQTQLWGEFNADLPTANVEPTLGSLIHKLRGDVEEQKAQRSVTPEGFAYAFFMANRNAAEQSVSPTPERERDAEARTEPQAEPAAPTAPTPPAAKVTYNTEKHSVEIGFARKPDEKVLASLKAAGFRWAKGNKVWYRKISAKGEGVVEPALEHARSLIGGADTIAAKQKLVRGEQAQAANVPNSASGVVVAPDGYVVYDATKTTAEARKLFNLPAYKAVAQRKTPWNSEAGYGDTPEEAQKDALRRVGANAAQDDRPTAGMTRERVTERILAAARKPAPNAEEAFEGKGTNGKWYRLGVSSMPAGVRLAEPLERRSIGWVVRSEQGTTVGKRYDSRDALMAAHKDMADAAEADFRRALEVSSNQRLAEQAKYWLKETVAVTGTEPAQTGEQDDTEADQRGEAPGEAGGAAPRRRVEASTPPSRRESDAQRAARKAAHYNEVFDVILERAQGVDPKVDPAALRAEFDARIGLLDELAEDYEQSGRNPRALLEAIAKAGGISIASEGADGMAGELRWVKESPASGPFGAYAGVRGVFQKRQMGGNGTTQFGHSLDDMLRFLEGNREFSHITTVNDLVAALQDIARLTDADRGGTFPGSRELAKLAGMVPDGQWWSPQASIDTLESDSAEPDDADVSFDPTTFDVLDTGETQGRLPGAEDVRDTDTQTPEFEAPFSLDGGADTTRKGSQRSIFDAPVGEEPTAAADTPEFKKWFGRSVAEEDGRPEVLYHGTDEVFSEFQRTEDIGFHFGPKATAEARLDQGEFNPRILMPVYLSVQRPLVLTDLHTWSPKNVLAALVDHHVITPAQAKTIDVVDRETVRDLLAKRGYDGIVYRNETEGGESYIVFRPEQIKSADRNSGAFSRTSPNIYDEAAPAEAPKPSPRAEVSAKRAEIIGKLKANLKNNINTGVDPQNVVLMVQLVRTYLDEGVIVAADAYRQFAADFGDGAEKLTRHFELAWKKLRGETIAVADFAAAKPKAAAPSEDLRAWLKPSAVKGQVYRGERAGAPEKTAGPIYFAATRESAETWGYERTDKSAPEAERWRQVAVKPAHILIESPYEIADFEDIQFFDAEDVARLAADGYDGAIHEDGDQSIYIAFGPEQVRYAASDTTTGEPNAVRTGPDAGADARAGESGSDRNGRPGTLGTVPAEDVRGPEAAGTDRPADGRPQGVSPDGVPDRAGDGGEPGTAQGDGGSTVPRDTLSPAGATHATGLKPSDYALTDERITGIIGRGTMTRARDNLAAIHLVKELWREGRYVTHDEQELLAKYVGWGAGDMAAFLADNPSPGWKATEKAVWQELRDVLTPQERKALTNSSTNAHFTYDLYRPIWKVLEAAGFTGGRVLEPAVGVGHAFGFMDPTVRANSTLSASELEPITATIAQALYPSARVQATGYEQARIARGTQDLVVSNVPFGKFGVADPSMTGDRAIFTRRIHNYFFGKALEHVRPGGLIVFVTSRYTMDSGEWQGVRRLLAKEAHFLGAVRLPNTAFDKSAKTEVVTDLIVLQKIQPGETPRNADAFINSSRHEGLSTTTKKWVKGKMTDVEANVYTSRWYQDNPQFILGTESLAGKMHGGQEYTVTAARENVQGDIRRMLAKVLPAGSYEAATTDGVSEAPTHVAEGYFKPGELSVRDGRLARVDREGNFSDVTPMRGDTVDTAAVKRVGKMIAVRDALRDTLAAMRDPEATDTAIKKAQKALTRAYDHFVKEYGQLNAPINKRLFRLDPEVTNLMALETLKTNAQRVATKKGTVLRVSYEVVGKADIFTKRLDVAREIEHAETPADALMASLGAKTRIDWPYMARLSGRTAEDLQTALAADGRVYQAPDGAWVLAEDYLSGDVRAKLADAKAAAETEPKRFAANVAALERVQPAPKTFGDIKVTLGSPYVPTDVVAQFIRDEVGGSVGSDSIHVGLDATTSYVRWDLRFGRDADLAGRNHPLAVRYGTPNSSGVGGKVYGFTDLVADALNLDMPTLGESVGSGKEKVFIKDEDGTRAARANVEEVRERWFSWLLSKPAVQDKVTAIYDERFGGVVNRTFDGAHLANYSDWNNDTQTGTRTAALPGLALKFPLFPHQLRAVWRILTTGNTLLAHEVGAGKTFEMIVAAMEMRRTGRARKPMIAVPTFLLQAWRQDILKAYPNARMLAFDEKDLAADKRQEAMARIAFGDWDIVLVPHSSFELLKVSDKRMAATLQEWVNEMMDAEKSAREQRGDDDEAVKKLAAARRRLEDKIRKKLDKAGKGEDNALTWDQLGVDALFVDEAHAFKNLYFATKISGLRGLSASESDRALDMFVKVKDINEQSNYRNLVLATATPVMNSMAEIYTMQRYLQPQELRKQGLESFDNWYAVFAEAKNGTEQAPDGTYQEVMRLRTFRNLDLLYRTVAQVMDYVGWKDMPYLKLPTVRGGVQIVQTDPHPIYPTLQQWFATRLANLRAMPPKYNRQTKEYTAPARPHALNPDKQTGRLDNILTVMNDAKLAAIDPRLLLPEDVTDWSGSRLQAAAKNMMEVYRREKTRKGVQLVFIDVGTPKDLTPLEFLGTTAIEDTTDGGALGTEDEITDGDEFYPPLEEGDFNLYEALKAELVKRGVPSREIAFIHQAAKPAERIALFEAAREGEVRFLFASTDKGGVGMNIQTRLAAEHHFDAPRMGRPGDIKQRDGRIIRQGNQYDEIDIFRYVTKGTTDEWLYGMLGSKSTMIGEFMVGNATEFEDEDPSTMSIEEAQVRATGNPLGIELVKLKSSLERLRAQALAEERTRQTTKDELARDIPHAERLQYEREALKEWLFENHEPIKGDAFKMTVDFKDFTDRAEANQALRVAATKVFTDQAWSPVQIGSLRGMPILAKHEAGWWGRRLALSLRTDAGIGDIEITTLDAPEGAQTVVGAGRNMVASATERYNSLPARLTLIENDLRQTENKIERAEAILAHPAEYVGRFTETTRRIAELETRLKEESAAKMAATDEAVKQGKKERAERAKADTPGNSGMPAATLDPAAYGDREIPFGPSTGSEKGRPEHRPSAIEAKLLKALGGIPRRIGRLPSSWMRGVFKGGPNTIRLRRANDLRAFFHESGHALDITILQIDRKDKRWAQELMDLGAATSKPSYSNGQVRMEGAAEFFHLYLLSPNTARTLAPNYFTEFERRLDEHPELRDALHEVREDLRGYVGLTEAERGRLMIDRSSTPGMVSQAISDPKRAVRKMAIEMIDDLQALNNANARMSDGGPVSMIDDGYVLARVARGAAGKAEAFLEHGVRGWGGKLIAPGLAEALAPIKGHLEALEDYMMALRSLEVIGRGKLAPMTASQANGVIAETKGRDDFKAFEKARDAVYEFQAATLEYARQYGAFSLKQIKQIEALNQSYVPMQRVMDAAEDSIRGVAKRIANRVSPVKRLSAKGSSRDVIAPTESIIRNTFAIVDMVEKNRAMQALVRKATKAQGSGQWIERIPTPKVATTFNLASLTKDIAAALDEAGVEDVPDNLDEALDELVTIFTPASFAKGDDQIVTVIVGGERQFWQVNDTDLYEAIAAIGPRDVGRVMQWMETPVKVLRAGATMTLQFMARNPGRDTIVAWLQSNHGFIPIYDTIRGAISQVRGDEDAQLFYSRGIQQAAMQAQDRNSRQRLVERLGKGSSARLRSIAANPLDILRGLGEFMETSTRMGEFKLVLDSGGERRGALERIGQRNAERPTVTEETLVRATIAARDVTTDFSRGGHLAKEINRFEAFFNARVQGYVRVAETARENPVGLGLKLGTLAALSAAIWFMNEDDDEYNELEEWEKHSYWHLKLQGTNRWLRIPKPFEFGYVPDVVEAGLEFAKKGSAERFRTMRQNLVGDDPLQLIVNLLPTGILPLAEVWANYDAFRDTHIVRPWDIDRIPTDQQYTDWTSETAKLLGQVIPVAPAMLDHIIYGYTAGLGRSAVDTIDSGLRMTGQAPTKGIPADASQRWPAVGAYLRDRSFGGSSRSIQDVYDLAQAIQTVENGAKNDREAGRPDAAAARIAAGREDLPWDRRAAILSGQKQLKEMGPRIRAIYAAPPSDMTPAEKRERLDRLYEQMVAVSRRALGRPPLARAGGQ